MESREASCFLPLSSPFFSFNMKPPQNPNHSISRFQSRPSSPQRINNYKPNSLYSTREFDLNLSNQSFHLTSRLLGGGPATLDGFSSNPFELGSSPFYANVFPYGSDDGVSKDVTHGGWGQYYDDLAHPQKNNNDDDDNNNDQKVTENEAGASRVKVTEGDDEYLINMANMQHDGDDLSKKKERRKEQEDGEGGIIKGQWSEEEDRSIYYVFVVVVLIC